MHLTQSFKSAPTLKPFTGGTIPKTKKMTIINHSRCYKCFTINPAQKREAPINNLPPKSAPVWIVNLFSFGTRWDLSVSRGSFDNASTIRGHEQTKEKSIFGRTQAIGPRRRQNDTPKSSRWLTVDSVSLSLSLSIGSANWGLLTLLNPFCWDWGWRCLDAMQAMIDLNQYRDERCCVTYGALSRWQFLNSLCIALRDDTQWRTWLAWASIGHLSWDITTTRLQPNWDAGQRVQGDVCLNAHVITACHNVARDFTID